MLAGQSAARYIAVGALVALTYLGLTLLLSGPVGVPIAPAVVVGYLIAVTLHFVLQRTYVFGHVEAFELPLRAQIGRYLIFGGTQLGATLASTRWLPGVLGISEQVVYLLTVAVLTAGGFLLLSNQIFHVDEVDAGDRHHV